MKTRCKHYQEMSTDDENYKFFEIQDREIPIKRCTVYEQLGISRNEGRLLCGLLGYGVTDPLTHQQISDLSRITKQYKKWKKNGLGIQKFIQRYQGKTDEH